MEIKRLSRGRPLGSLVRQNIINILFMLKEGYGNDIHKAYCDIFPHVSKRAVYYHLKKGCELGIFKIAKTVSEPGEFSWGGMSEKTYYALGSHATPNPDSRIIDYFNTRYKR